MPGERLPSEVELCQLYQASRTTVRQALSTLAQDGLVLRRQGSGTFVSDRAGDLIHLSIVVPRGYVEEATRSLADLYSTRNPRVHVRVQSEPFSVALNLAHRAICLRDSDPIDAIMVPSTFMSQAAHSGHLEPLDRYIEQFHVDLVSDFVSTRSGRSALDLVCMRTVLGHRSVYGLPYQNDVQVLYYRADLLDELGFAVPCDMQDYLAIVQALHERGRSYEPRLYGNAIAASSSTFCVIDSWLWILKALGGDLFVGDLEPAVDSELAVTSLELLRELFLLSPPGSQRFSSYDAARAMWRGEAGLMANWHIFANRMEAPNAPLRGKVRYSLLPGRLSQLAGWELCMTSSSPHKEETFSFLTFLTSGDSEVQDVFQRKGGDSYRVSSLSNPAYVQRDPVYAVVREAWQSGWTLGEWPEYERLAFCIIQALQALLTGEVTARTAARRMVVSLAREAEFQRMRSGFMAPYVNCPEVIVD
jgi:ABC-type glycerol-3-phosphate transport system substrate-binding protein